MSVFKCKMCGGNLEVVSGSSVVTCEYCGTNQTISKTRDEVIQNLFNRANDLRIKCEFDRAEQTYEKILEQDNSEAEAHWGIVLCQYGIEYVEDPSSKKRIPTCHRTSYESIVANADYIAAIDNADDEQKEVYRKEASEIDAIQKDILSIVKNEDPFDVFICYKETDKNGKRTVDSAISNDIYYQLVQEGFKVFYAPITLEDKLGREYEPYIFAALNSSKVMLVVGTKPEYFNAVWVKNEWSRYLKLLKQDRTKLLIPCYRDMDAYDLPDEFAHLQSQDMGKIGFIQDLIRGINKVITKEAPAPKKEEPKVEVKEEPNTPSRLMVIEDDFTITGRGTVITGRIENGSISINESVTINNRTFVVTGIEEFRKLLTSASAGMNVGLLLQGATKETCRAGDNVYKGASQSQPQSVPFSAPATPDDIARELLNAGYHERKLEAIKILRERTGLGLADAKNVIDRVFASAGYGTYTPASTQKSGGCYVATCVYGSYDCPQVWTLRRFRDNTLASTWYGRAFIRTYYAISPTIVKWFGNTQWFKNIWKNKLDKMVSNLRSNGVEDTPYQDKNWR